MSSMNIEAPPSAQEFDELLYQIDAGKGPFKDLDEDRREQLKQDLTEQWLSEYLTEYPVPADLGEASQEYRNIEDAEMFPNLPQQVREDLLLLFNDHHGEGGPDEWAGMEMD